MNKLTTKIGDVTLKSPIILASGTCNFGRELSSFYDLSILGGLSSKGLTLKPRQGNPGTRIAECDSGILNSVGLQNPGVEYFINNELSYMKSLNTGVIVNVAGHSYDDYENMVRLLDPYKDDIDALEINLSCPNVKAGCMSIGSDPNEIYKVVSMIKKLTTIPLWIKLTPNVTDIKVVSKASEDAGADAVVLINTLLGMRIDIKTRRPVLKNNTGGYSGPAIKPIAIRMVNEAYQVLNIPIIGCGGIMNYEDVLEFILAGASAVEIGTGNLIHPTIGKTITDDLNIYFENQSYDIMSLVGEVKLW